jgi:hypothetical protein
MPQWTLREIARERLSSPNDVLGDADDAQGKVAER